MSILFSFSVFEMSTAALAAAPVIQRGFCFFQIAPFDVAEITDMFAHKLHLLDPNATLTLGTSGYDEPADIYWANYTCTSALSNATIEERVCSLTSDA